MNSLYKYILTSFLFILLITGCDVAGPDDFVSEYVVESYMFALEPLPEVRLSKSAEINQAYIFKDRAVANAEVNIQLLDENGEVAETFSYFEAEKGIYKPNDSTSLALPIRTYKLNIFNPSDNQNISATTTIPDSFSAVQAGVDSIVYLATEQVEVTVTQSFTAGRQNVFIFSTENFDNSIENLTPFWASIFETLAEDSSDGEPFDTTNFLDELRINESPLLNEANYEVQPNGTLTIKVPWLVFNFYKLNRLVFNVVDDNVFDFMTSQQIQGNPSTLSPGELPAVIDHIDGGIGIFGSYARLQKDIFVIKPF